MFHPATCLMVLKGATKCFLLIPSNTMCLSPATVTSAPVSGITEIICGLFTKPIPMTSGNLGNESDSIVLLSTALIMNAELTLELLFLTGTDRHILA